MTSRSHKILNLLNLPEPQVEQQNESPKEQKDSTGRVLENTQLLVAMPGPSTAFIGTPSKRSSRSSSSSSSSSSRSDSSSSTSTTCSSRQSSRECSPETRALPIFQDDVIPSDEQPLTPRPQSASPSLLTLQNVEPTAVPITTIRAPPVDYRISPVNSAESDAEVSDNDPTYNAEPEARQRSLSSSSNTSSINTTNTTADDVTLTRTLTRKRKANPAQWKQNNQKIKRNLGEQYISNFTKKLVPAREMKPPCSQKCRLKCSDKLDHYKRMEYFKSFWALGNLQLQRMFISSSMSTVTPKYKYTNAATPRNPNKAYYFNDGDEKIKVCKTFFINTLGITQKMIRTVQIKNQNGIGIEEDKRGRHTNHKSVSDALKNDIRNFINSIPRIESHYLRASTSREYISGSKSIADLFRDFEQLQRSKSLDAGRFHTFYEMFSTQFNIGFFQPKKDQCDLCLQYVNSTGDQKRDLKEKYDTHLEEKNLSREEKKKDRKNVDDHNLCVCFDVQAIMQSPNGESSAFYYKSKLNSYNFTITELLKLKEDNQSVDDCKSYGDVHCYFWDETQGKRGAVEIGSCILDYLKRVSENSNQEINITFISDNCCGQNKNKYIAALFMFAVTNIKNLKTITHKYLIKGHTQNEADNVHSLIQKQITKDLKTGPIYTPIQYIAAIQRARKTGKPFIIHTLTYDFFYDVKELQGNWGYNFNTDEQKNTVVWNNIKVMKFTKENPFIFYYKTSYNDEDFKEINVRNKRKKMLDLTEISIQQAYRAPIELSSNKKKDLQELVSKKLIDPYYANYFDSMLL